MKKKKVYIPLVVCLVIGTSLLISNIAKNTTYGEVISSLIEGKAVDEIYISNEETDEVISISDTEPVKKIIELPFKMKIKESDGINDIDYIVFIKSGKYNTDVYDIYLSKDRMYIGGSFYYAKNTNLLYQIVEDMFNRQMYNKD